MNPIKKLNDLRKQAQERYCARLANIYRELQWTADDQIYCVLRLIYGAVMIPLVCDLLFTFAHQIMFELAVELDAMQEMDIFESIKAIYSVVRWPVYYMCIRLFWRNTTMMSWNYSYLHDCQVKIITQKTGRCPRCGHYMDARQYMTQEEYFTGEYRDKVYYDTESTTDHRGETHYYTVKRVEREPVYATRDVKHDYVTCKNENCGFQPEIAYWGSRKAYKFREMPHDLWETERFITDRNSNEGCQYGSVFLYKRFKPLYSPLFVVLAAIIAVILIADQYYIPFAKPLDILGCVVIYVLVIWNRVSLRSSVKSILKTEKDQEEKQLYKQFYTECCYTKSNVRVVDRKKTDEFIEDIVEYAQKFSECRKGMDQHIRDFLSVAIPLCHVVASPDERTFLSLLKVADLVNYKEKGAKRTVFECLMDEHMEQLENIDRKNAEKFLKESVHIKRKHFMACLKYAFKCYIENHRFEHSYSDAKPQILIEYFQNHSKKT